MPIRQRLQSKPSPPLSKRARCSVWHWNSRRRLRKLSRQSFQRKNYERVDQETIRSRNRNAQSEANSYALRLTGRFLLGLRPLRYTSPSTVSLSVLYSPRSMSVAICAFSDAWRSLVIASSRRRSGRVILVEIPVRMRQTRTRADQRESLQDSYVRQGPLGRHSDVTFATDAP